jgi:hypothetical protein
VPLLSKVLPFRADEFSGESLEDVGSKLASHKVKFEHFVRFIALSFALPLGVPITRRLEKLS